MHFWPSTTHVQEGPVLLSDLPYKGKARPDVDLLSKAGLPLAGEAFSAREWAAWLLSPDRYRERWRFAQHSTDALKERGIPLEELRASAVREPGPRKRLWLLHKKCFRFVRDEHGEEVADPTQKVPVCPECAASLHGRAPRLPKFSLANDFWMGQLPPQLRGLSEGAWLLLALARPFIRRFGCLTDSGKWTHPEERIKAFIGNVCAFTQADGGSLVAKLPPRAEDLVGRITIAFAGSDGDLKRARLRSLAVSPAAFKRAYDYLHRCNPIYAAVGWDEAAAMDLARDRSVLGLPACLGACVRVDEGADPKAQSVRQEGPGEAVQGESDEIPPHEKDAGEGPDSNDLGEPEEGEYVAGVADRDVELDMDRAVQNIKTSLQRQEVRARRVIRHQEEMREQHGRHAYESLGAQEELRGEHDAQARTNTNETRLREMEEQITAAERSVQGLRVAPSMEDSSVYAQWLDDASQEKTLLVPTQTNMQNMFDPYFWTSLDPCCFVYGDGAYGIDREVPVSFPEYLDYICSRDELSYELRATALGRGRSLTAVRLCF
jgi:hypothetical protein